MKLSSENKYFHSKDKGCKLVFKKYFMRKEKDKAGNEHKYYLRAQFCQTHQKEMVCRCGWEFGHHYEYSKLKKKMKIKYFNKKYEEQGGIKQLSNMRENFETLKKIAEQFDVSVERVRQWMINFFGEKYDPRYKRREKTIKTVRDLIDKHGLEKTQELYPGINKSYLQAAQQKNEK